jgi:hypothetical protein
MVLQNGVDGTLLREVKEVEQVILPRPFSNRRVDKRVRHNPESEVHEMKWFTLVNFSAAVSN